MFQTAFGRQAQARARSVFRHPAALAAAAVFILTSGTFAQDAPDTGSRASGPSVAPLTVQITSPRGRTGMVGHVRIVARITHAPGVTLSPVQFFVDDQLVGQDKDGPPYAVEWVDDNPLALRQISVQVADSSGGTARDVFELRPLEVIERAFVSSVLVEPSVRDAKGRPVNDLTATDFRVTEDDVPQIVEMAGTDVVPANYTLLIDSSQSMSRHIDVVRNAASQLPGRLRRNDSITVIPFSRTLGAVTGPTQDHDTVLGAIQAIRSSGGTAILDCLTTAAKELQAMPGRNILVLITDGYDENSVTLLPDVMNVIKASKVTVYVIAIGGVAGVSLRGETVLKSIATATGGRAFFPSRAFQLSDVHGLIASDVQQRYVLSYAPTNQKPDGMWREIKVTTADPTHAILARPGYMAPVPPPVKAQFELTVRDLTRQLIDITPEDFSVFEDGVEQTVEGFEESLTPISMMLVLDSSGSMRRDAAGVMEAARVFARELPGKDRVGVITFADRPELTQDLTTIREFILGAIGKYQATGGTALYDAVYVSLDRLKTTEGRTAIVVLTDGRDEDNPGTGPGSKHTLADLLARLREVKSTVYAIGLGPNVDRATLEQIATESRGEAYFPADVDALSTDYRRIVENLRRRYTISYTSTNRIHDGAWRKVEIRPKRQGLAIEFAGGYTGPTLDN